MMIKTSRKLKTIIRTLALLINEQNFLDSLKNFIRQTNISTFFKQFFVFVGYAPMVMGLIVSSLALTMLIVIVRESDKGYQNV